MKSGNTLRVARNSLLCFFMALVAGFLIACGDGGVATPRETPNAPARPAAPSASAQSDIEIEVTWSAVSRATIYNLYRSPSSGGTYSLAEGDITALRYRDNRGLAPNTEYYYQLEACNSDGCSEAFARSFGHHPGFASRAERVSAKRKRDFGHLERGIARDDLQSLSVAE